MNNVGSNNNSLNIDLAKDGKLEKDVNMANTTFLQITRAFIPDVANIVCTYFFSDKLRKSIKVIFNGIKIIPDTDHRVSAEDIPSCNLHINIPQK